MKSNETIVTNTRRPSRMEVEVDDEVTADDDDITFSLLTIEDDLLLLLGIINGVLP